MSSRTELDSSMKQLQTSVEQARSMVEDLAGMSSDEIMEMGDRIMEMDPDWRSGRSAHTTGFGGKHPNAATYIPEADREKES